jgi:threonine dehydrogenase-like Zn-dependent dehydrogenase
MVAGLCRTDVYAARGQLGCEPRTVLGHEASGVLLEVSPGSVPGDALRRALSRRGRWWRFTPSWAARAARPATRDGRITARSAQMLGVGRDGVFTEEVVLPLSACVPLPGLTDARRAAFLEPFAAALGVVACMGLPRDARVLVMGSGRVATLTEHVLRSEGYAHVVLAERPPAGESFDVGVETRAEAERLDLLARAVRPFGTLVVKSRPATRVPASFGLWAQRDLCVRGVSYAPFALAAERLADASLDVSPWLGPLHSFEDFGALLAADSAEAGRRERPPAEAHAGVRRSGMCGLIALFDPLAPIEPAWWSRRSRPCVSAGPMGGSTG